MCLQYGYVHESTNACSGFAHYKRLAFPSMNFIQLALIALDGRKYGCFPSMYSNYVIVWDEGRELLTAIKLEIMAGIKMYNRTMCNVPIKEEQHTKPINV